MLIHNLNFIWKLTNIESNINNYYSNLNTYLVLIITIDSLVFKINNRIQISIKSMAISYLKLNFLFRVVLFQ